MRFPVVAGLLVLGSCSPPPKVQEQLTPDSFLAKAAAEPGAMKLPSGLIYDEVEKGAGPSPAATDTVRVHYRGTLMDGTEFESSYKNSEPVEVPLHTVIPCWREGLQRMKVGGKSRLICPANIAYGAEGRPPAIPGGAPLIFEMALVGIGHQ
jgi:FKBP-type peptidyl-prolyl cis-trans isomerase FkpA